MILIVDDKPENLLSLKRLLELHNFSVDTAGSGEEALKKILNNTYGLFILDVQMPGMDGFEVAEAISGYSRAKHTPIIFLSAVNTDKKFITKGYTSGGIDYLTKPVDPDIFIMKVKTLHRLYEQNLDLSRLNNSLRDEMDTRKNAELELNKTLKELHSVMEAIPQIAFTINAAGMVDYANEQWYLYSNKLDELPEAHPDDKFCIENWAKAFASEQPYSCELRIKNKITNEYRYHLLKIIPMRQQDSPTKWVGTYTDINEHKMANELLELKVKERTAELLLKNAELEASNLELQQFASVASHDLKEPLRKIQVFSSIIRSRHLNGTDEALNSIDRIMESSNRMSMLISDLLDYSRLSVDVLFQPTDLKQIVEETLRDLELTINEKNAVIDIGPLCTIDAIPGQMRQVFQNLITNSLKFVKKDTIPHISIHTELVADKKTDVLPDLEGKYCRIVVSDNGIGFNQQFAERIFTLFQRLNPKETYEGTGIGLAIAKKIIDKHNGIIYADSVEGNGASFVIIVPIHQGIAIENKN